MAQVRWYLNNTLLDGWQLVDQTAATAATMNCGWVVGTGATFSSELQSNTERASTTFVANTVPDGTLDTTLKDAFRSQFAQTGSFAAGNWTFQFAVVSTVQSGAADGQIMFRVLKADADGANATEITTAQQATTIATNVAGTDINITATWAAPAWTITNQYLFVQVAWKRTGAGGMTTTNIRLRTGSSATVGTTGLTADFTPAVTTAHRPSTIVISGTETPKFSSSPLSGNYGTGMPGYNAAQTIIGTGSEALTSIEFDLAKTGTPTDSVYLEVRQGTQTGTLLATSPSYPLAVLPTFPTWGVVKFVLPGLISLEMDVGYWFGLFLTRTAESGSNYLQIRHGSYPFGAAYDNLGAQRTDDFSFRARQASPSHIVDAPPPAGADQGVTTQPIASTVGLNVPTVRPDQGVTTPPIASSAVLNVATVAPPEAAVVGAFIAPRFQRFVTPFTVQAGQISGTLTQFPTYVNQTLARFKSVANGGHVLSAQGYDLLPFANAACTTRLDFDRLFYDPTTGQVEDFIRVPSAAVGTTVYYGSGDPAITTNQSNAQALWAGGPGGSGVWHLVKNGVVTGADAINVTNGTITGATVSAGGGALFNGTSGKVTLPDSGTILKPTNIAFTISGIIRSLPTQTNPTAIFCSYNQLTAGNVAGISFGVNIDAASQHLLSIVLGPNIASPGNYSTYKGTTVVDDGNPHWFVIVGTGSALRIYVDGGADQAVLSTGSGYLAPGYLTPTYIRIASEATDIGGTAVEGKFFPGVLDKIQFYSGLAKTQAWAAATYANQSNQATFFGTTQSEVLSGGGAFPPTVALVAGPPDQGVTTQPIASTAVVNAATVAAGPVTITTGTRVAAAVLNVPTVVPGPVTVTGATLASTAILRVATVIPQSVTITAGTCASAVQVNQPAVSTGIPRDLRNGMIAHWPMNENTASANAEDVHADHDLYMIGTGQNAQNPIDGTPARDFEADSSNYMTLSAPAKNVTGVFIGSTALLFAPTLAAGPVSVTTAYRATTLALNAPTIAVGPVTVVGAHVPTTLQVFAPTVTTGPVAVTTGTRVAAAVVNAPSLAVGPVAVTTGTITATAQLNTPVVQALITGATIVSGNQRFAPSVALTLTTGTITTTIQAFAPTVGLGLTTAFISSALIVRVPTVATGPVPVTTAFIASTSVLNVPSVSTGAASVTGGTVLSTLVLNAPSVSLTVVGATRSSALVVFPPSVTTTTAVTAGTIAPTVQLFTPTVALAAVQTVTLVTRASALVMNAPTVAPGPVTVTGAFITSTVVTYAPTVVPGAVIVGGVHRPTTIQAFAPSVAVGPVAVTTPPLTSSAQLFTPALTAIDVGSIGAATITTTAVANAPSVVGGLAIIGAQHVASTAILRPATVTAGPVTLIGVTIASTGLRFALTLVVGAVAVTSPAYAATTQLFLPVVAAAGVTAVGGQTIAATTLTTPPTVATGPVTVLATTLASTATLTQPSVSAGGITVGGPTRLSGAQNFAPSVATGAVTVIGGTCAPTTQVFAPSLTGAVTSAFIGSANQRFAPTVLALSSVGGATRSSTLQMFAPTVATGPVSVVGGTRASALLTFEPSVLVGGTLVTGGYRASTTVLFPPSFVSTLDGTFITAGSQLFPPTVQITQFVTGGTIPTGQALFAPSLLPLTLVAGPTRASATLLFPPSLTVGAVTVVGSTVPGPAFLYPPSLGAGAVTVTLPFIAAASLVRAPSVDVTVVTPHRGTTLLLFAPSLATGPVSVLAPTRTSTLQTYPPTLGAGVTGGTILSTTLTRPPTLLPVVSTPLWVVSTIVYAPGVATLGEMFAQHIPSGTLLFPPFMVAHGPPSEYHDFVANLVRAVSVPTEVCRAVDEQVILTRLAVVETSVDRAHEASPSLIRRGFVVDLER